MKKLTIAAAIAAVAIAITMPFALGQSTPNSNLPPQAASSPDKQEQGTYGPGMMGGNAQNQGPNQGGYGPGMMGGNAQNQGQSQGGYGPGMMGGYGFGWMGGYGGLWVPILLVLLVGGLVTWVVRQKKK